MITVIQSPSLRLARVHYQSQTIGESVYTTFHFFSSLAFQSIIVFFSPFHFFFLLVYFFLSTQLKMHLLSTSCSGQGTFALCWSFCLLCQAPSRMEKWSFLEVQLKHWPNTALRYNLNLKQINRISHLFTCLQLSILLNTCLDGSQKAAVNWVEIPEIVFLLLR